MEAEINKDCFSISIEAYIGLMNEIGVRVTLNKNGYFSITPNQLEIYFNGKKVDYRVETEYGKLHHDVNSKNTEYFCYSCGAPDENKKALYRKGDSLTLCASKFIKCNDTYYDLNSITFVVQ